MSKLTEYLSLIPKAFGNPVEILEGTINTVKMRYGTLPEDEQNEIVRRRIICTSCPFLSSNAVTSEEYKQIFGKNYITNRTESHCSVCACPIESKTSSLNSTCGLASDTKTNHLPLKWTKYEKNGI